MTIAEAELRGLVREVLSDALPTLRQKAETRSVQLANDGDLAAFISEILAIAADKSSAARLRSGLLTYTLAAAPAAPAATASAAATSLPVPAAAPVLQQAPAPVAAPAQARPSVTQPSVAQVAPAASTPPAPSSVLRVEKGAVTERVISQAAESNSKLVLGARAILTPLARESARKRNVVIERAS